MTAEWQSMTWPSEFAVRIVVQPSLGVAAARNRGVDEASGELILFTDDDCQVDNQWIVSHVRRLEREPRALVMGRVLNGLPQNPWSGTHQALHDVVVEWFNQPGSGPGFFTGNNFSLRRADWRTLGGMRADWKICGGEEREFVLRWAGQGGRVVIDPAAIVRHFHDLTAMRFLGQQFRYGRGAWLAHRGELQKRDLYRRILTSMPGVGGRARLAASQAAVAAGMMYEAAVGSKQKGVDL